MSTLATLNALSAMAEQGRRNVARNAARRIDPNAEGVYRVVTTDKTGQTLQHFSRNGELTAASTDNGIFTSFREAQDASNRLRCQLAANFRGYVEVKEIWRRGETGGLSIR